MTRKFGLCAALALCAWLRASEHPEPAQTLPEKIEFNRDVRPILSSICFNCHGPDKAARKADLRLDTLAGATDSSGGSAAIVPGNLQKSELYKRIVSKDPEEMMPPPKAHHTLTAREIAVLGRWIEQGAKYAEHWAFIKPQRPGFPAPLFPESWNRRERVVPRNGIDNFILDRLAKEGLVPSPEADRHALIRRAALDLTGLPPSPEEVETFINDKSADAYEKLVDRLLASPAYGERWARMWLDLARYADSAGYGSDPLRMNIWPYRDWVIDAFNRNLPYDQFTTEQIAGDLLPNATQNQILASAFHRNTMTNTEGGTDDEEFRVAAVKDRANTTSLVWMGLTMGCAQCHSHKFDPISQKEYYQFFALFNQTEDADRGNEAPTMPMPTPSQRQQIEKMKAELAALEAQLEHSSPQLEAEQAAWEKTAAQAAEWSVLDPLEFSSANGATLAKQADKSLLASGKSPATDTYTISAKTDLKNITAVRLEVLPDDSLPAKGPGRAGGNFVLGDFRLAAQPATPAPVRGRYVRVENRGKGVYLSLAEVQVFSSGRNLALSANGGKATQSSTDFDGPPNLAIDNNTSGDYHAAKSTTHTKAEDNPWWEVDLGSVADLQQVALWNRTDGGTHTRLNNCKVSILDAERKEVWQTALKTPPNPSVTLELTGARPIALRNATADFSQDNFSVEKAIDGDTGKKFGWAISSQLGKPHVAVFETASDAGKEGATLSFTLAQPFGTQHTIGRLRLSVTSAPPPVRILPQNVSDALASEAGKRSDAQKKDVAAYFRSLAPSLAPVRAQIGKLNATIAAVKPPSVPIMRELAAGKQRKTHILNKGNFLTPGEKVEAGLPAKFHPLPAGAPMNRLGLAQWLMDKENPLTARVAVNRFWAQIFGRGLVETEEDFGTQGRPPSHPELLDWLALEFVENADNKPWDMKRLLKLIVTSAAYRQSSRLTPDALEKDALNRYLSRFPRRRLDAEQVRDQALALSGLLSKKIGGPSVYPPQPDGLWRAAFNGERTWPTSTGEDRYRRGMYIFWRRTVPYPSMATFDVPSREICTIRRMPTNTPLQAFVTLNDPAFVECAQALARRMVKEGGVGAEAIARYGLKLCLSRPPQDEQVQALVQLYKQELEKYRANAEAARKMSSEPLGALPPDLDAAEMAAWTVVANVLLNLDGVLTKG